MKIDWTAGFWFVWDIKTGNRLAKLRQLHLSVPTQLFSEQEPGRKGNWHGWLIASGILRVEGDIGYIE